MRKVYHLGTCSTCQCIIKELALEEKGFEMQDIKTSSITAQQLDALKDRVGSYEQLFSRRALKFRSLGLNKLTLKEEDYRNYILQEYTFLKRPVICVDDRVFVGNAKKTVEAVAEILL